MVVVVVAVGKALHRRHQSQGKPESNGPICSMAFQDLRFFFLMSSCKAVDFSWVLLGKKGLANHGPTKW